MHHVVTYTTADGRPGMAVFRERDQANRFVRLAQYAGARSWHVSDKPRQMRTGTHNRD